MASPRSVSATTASVTALPPTSLPEKAATNARLSARLALLETQVAGFQQEQNEMLALLSSLNQAMAEHNHSIGSDVAQQISGVAAQAAVLHMNEHLQTLLSMGTTLLEKQQQ